MSGYGRKDLQTIHIDNPNLDSINSSLAEKSTQQKADITEFGAIGDGVVNDLTPITNALHSKTGQRVVFFPPNKTFAISGAIPIESNVIYLGYNTKIKQLSANTPIFLGTGVQNVQFIGLNLEGLGTDFVESGQYTDNTAAGIYLRETTQSQNITIKDCEFRKFGHADIYLRNVDGFEITDNYIEGLDGTIITSGKNYQFGLRLIDGISNGVIKGNRINKGSQGIYLDHTISNINVVSNIIENITGQHGCYAADGTGLVFTNNNLSNIALDGIKVQLDNLNTRDSVNTIISNNNFSGITGNGITLINTVSPYTYRVKNASITGNNISVTGLGAGDGIIVLNADGVNVSNNIINVARYGIRMGDSTKTVIRDNMVLSTQQTGIYVNYNNSSICKDIRILNNYVLNCATSNVTGNNYGMSITGTDKIELIGNVVDDENGKQRYAIFVQNDSTLTNVIIEKNRFLRATDYSIRFLNATIINRYDKNEVLSTLGLPTVPMEGVQRKQITGNAIPITGTYAIGDVVYNSAPVASGKLGWVCVTAGTPGTWKAFGAIDA